MALYVKDREVDGLVRRVAALHRVSKTEAVRRALIHELERVGAEPTLVERGVSFARELRARAGAGACRSIDKTFIDNLYDDA